jgi:hypothetical protein
LWPEFERAGHFAAMQVPDLLIADMRKFFRPLRGNSDWPKAAAGKKAAQGVAPEARMGTGTGIAPIPLFQK